MTRACFLSAAMIMTVPTSPTFRQCRQSLNSAQIDRNQCKDERLAAAPADSQPAFQIAGAVGLLAAGALLEQRKLGLAQRMAEHGLEEATPRLPRFRVLEVGREQLRTVDAVDDGDGRSWTGSRRATMARLP